VTAPRLLTGLPYAVRVWRRSMLLYRRHWRTHVIPSLVEPATYLVGIGLGVGGLIDTRQLHMSYVRYLAPGLIAVTVMQGAAFETTIPVFFKLRGMRLYEAVLVTPLTAADVVLGELLWGLTRAILHALPFLVLTGLLGYLAEPSAALLLPALVLIGLSFASLGLVVVSVIERHDMFQYFFNLLIAPMLLLSGVFFPISHLGRAAVDIAWFSPLLHAVQACRDLLLYDNPVGAGGHLLWLAGSAILFLPLAVRRLTGLLEHGRY
jgi:lipooligosaccharide transport system permease protein